MRNGASDLSSGLSIDMSSTSACAARALVCTSPAHKASSCAAREEICAATAPFPGFASSSTRTSACAKASNGLAGSESVTYRSLIWHLRYHSFL